MTSRKNLIIQESINLFNEKGCINTSTRHIASKLGISVGNLYYYFKNKEEIIIAIYEEFMSLISKQLTSVRDGQDLAFDYYDFLQQQMTYELKYRFFRLELNNIYQNYPKVKEAFEKSHIQKKQQIKYVYTHQIKYGYMKRLEEDELDFLVSNTWIIVTQWEIYWLIDRLDDEKQRRRNGILNILYFIKPYMTIKGLEDTNLLTSINYLNKKA
ncbi:TetR/AcrR family transcriptional regulator [Arcobacter roscoffensis]|uniref:TetR/AcrR family transcriptional regulator n=1 Tax=Arcobacter roscoffensis TaxID=2961520 RepID=A0ABY5E7S2_9BACT|nr:TetR/AcrR family transcriptional regulator [Arcobacter roscoffensis]UTJ07225.1 TetR/AcrR family transcriptional regulator [Arcobacter roscoffensis]